jgi:hypothetical protein
MFLGKVSGDGQKDHITLSRRFDTKRFNGNAIHVLPRRPVTAKDAQWLGHGKVS